MQHITSRTQESEAACHVDRKKTRTRGFNAEKPKRTTVEHIAPIPKEMKKDQILNCAS